MRTTLFLFGLWTHAVIVNIYQDGLGKEKYLRAVDYNWMDTSIWFWWWSWVVSVFIVIYLDQRDSRGKENGGVIC